jgi:uncharacterized OsmC-like protein
MDSNELRELQAPLKEKYRDDPSSAVVTLTARGDLADGAIACKVETGRALVQAGLHPATGGSGFDACSGDMLLEALVACAGVDTDEPEDRRQNLLRLTERYCVVLQTLRASPKLTATLSAG